jgi:membrane associated rhomboid family serine protease/ribosomal protein L37AE/L43A
MLTCPRCAGPLKALRFGPKAIWGCADCGGCAGAFALLRDSIHPERWKPLRRAVALAAAPSPRPCPSCRNPMLEADMDGVALETCRRCQLLWFDRGEAPEPLPHTPLSPEAAEAAARMKVAAIAARWQFDMEGDEDLTVWRALSIRFGLPFEVEAPETTITPWATIGLAVVIIAIGLLTLGDATWVARYGFVPTAPLRHGGTTLVTYFFLHSGLVHLFGNAYFLAVFGDNVEEAAGRGRFLAMALVGAAAGALVHALLDPRGDVPLIGASAGISAILVYYVFRFPGARIGWLAWSLPAWGYGAIWIVFQFLGVLRQAAGLTRVSAFAHLGGAAVGVAFWAWERRMTAWTSRDGPRS